MKISWIKDIRHKASAMTRLAMSTANNNGGCWWVCISPHTVAALERMFQDGQVASNLYENVGGILGDPALRTGNSRQYIYIQFKNMDPYIRCSLDDLGIEPVGIIKYNNITNH